MELLKRILVATDLSESSENVLENAIDMAKVFESEVALIYVLPAAMGSKKASELLHEFAAKQLNALTEKIKTQGVAAMDPILEQGDFSEKIIEASEKINANIIFAGAGEKSKKEAILLGSNAEKIIKKSNKPVFIIKNETSLSIKKILCPVDFSNQSKRALKNAITLAHRFEAELIIISVYGLSDLFPIRNQLKMDEHLEYLRKNHESDLEAFLKGSTFGGLKLTKEIRQGEPASEILKAIKEYETDLLIMGTTGKSGINKILIGSVTQKVIREIPSSFITLKEEDVIILELESKLQDIESHYKTAQQLHKDGFFKEAVEEYKKCINLSFTHIPSMQGLSKVYKELGDTTNENKYNSMMKQILERMDYEKIETEIRRFRS